MVDRFHAVAFSPAGEFYAATHPKGVLPHNEFNVVKIDIANGKCTSVVQGGCRAVRHCFQRPKRRKREEDGSKDNDGAAQAERRSQPDDLTRHTCDKDA